MNHRSPRSSHAASLSSNIKSGVLVVSADRIMSERLCKDLAVLEVVVTTTRRASDALDLLARDSGCEVLVIAPPLTDMSPLEVCKRARADVRMASTYVVVIGGEGDELRMGRGADEVLASNCSAEELQLAMRAALRAQALRRLLARSERRHAVAWLATVVSHEINNPLTLAFAGEERLAELLGKTQLDEQDLAEARELVGENRAALVQMRQAASRLIGGRRFTSAAMVPTSLTELTRDARARLVERGLSLRFAQDRRSAPDGSFDRALLLDAIEEVAVATHVAGGVDLRLHIDACRIAVVIEVAASGRGSPEALLEPRLEVVEGSPHYVPGLSPLEEALESGGGQLFSSRRGDRWRFGIVLPTC